MGPMSQIHLGTSLLLNQASDITLLKHLKTKYLFSFLERNDQYSVQTWCEVDGIKRPLKYFWLRCFHFSKISHIIILIILE